VTAERLSTHLTTGESVYASDEAGRCDFSVPNSAAGIDPELLRRRGVVD
jgi:hypothetical protein